MNTNTPSNTIKNIHRKGFLIDMNNANTITRPNIVTNIYRRGLLIEANPEAYTQLRQKHRK